MDEAVYRQMCETIGKGEVWNGELLNRKKNGELFWEQCSISPIRNNREQITNCIAIKENITERKEQENIPHKKCRNRPMPGWRC
ncbi:MAG: PAS domain-containing protein [Proteobacteria bacterium]|nr:PAS domain-containing protein [Pseudomonadota bacterium]